MGTDPPKPTPQTVLKLAQQLNSKNRYKVILELIATLAAEQLEDLQLEVEHVLTARTFLNEEISTPAAIKKRRKIEIKYINGKAYVYLRWRDRSEPDKYLGPMPLIPGKTYRLTHRTDGTLKVLAVLGLQLEENEQVYLSVQLLEPYAAVKSYLYPECLEHIFSKKQWLIELLPTQQLS
ncbi:MAG TPA: hypothetical protein V6C63_11625 [Allocoleopsis sp.]